MSESILSHLLLYERLSWDLLASQDKIREKDVTDQSRFLSSLALVLNGSTPCTAVYVDRSDKIVFIARNEPITKDDKRYFDRFFRQIRIYSALASLHSIKDKAVTEEALDQLDSLVFEYNSKKIIKNFLGRNFTAVIDGLRKMVEWNTDDKRDFIKELKLNKESYRNNPLMTEKRYLISKNYTEEDYMEFLLKKVNEFLIARDQLVNEANQSDGLDDRDDPDDPDDPDNQICLAESLAMILYHSRLFRFILNHSIGTAAKGVHYFEKTSAHIRAKNLLLQCLLNNKEHYGEIYKNISWKLVSPIKVTHQLNITPRQAFETIFNNLPRSSDETMSNVLQETTSDSFYDKYLAKLKIIDEKPIYVGLVHAEILLIDYLLKNNINQNDHFNQLEIGISKMPCLLCSFYISALNKKHDRCFYRSDTTHGKIYGKWIYRSNEDPLIINEINEKLIEKLQYLIEKILLQGARKGDPKTSGDSDVMSTSMEGDEMEERCHRRVDP